MHQARAGHSPVHLYGAGAIGTAGETPQAVFAEATGLGDRTSCTHILLIHPSHHYCVEHAKKKKARVVKGERTGIFPLGLMNESVVCKAFLTDECEACVW